MGPDEPWPSGDGRVYVGNLDYKVSQDELTEIMSKAGKVLTCTIPVDNKGRSRGYAMLRYASETISVPALKLLNMLEVNGRKILVREDREPLSSRRKGGNSDSKDVKEENGVVSKKPTTRRNRQRRSGRNNGSKNGSNTSHKSPVSDTSNNEISFESKKNNGQARQSIIRPKIKLDEESAGALVYFGNIPWSVGKGDIMEFVGGMECQIPTDKRGRSKGYALIRYDSNELANEAIARFNEFEWIGRNLIVRLFEFKHTNHSDPDEAK